MLGAACLLVLVLAVAEALTPNFNGWLSTWHSNYQVPGFQQTFSWSNDTCINLDNNADLSYFGFVLEMIAQGESESACLVPAKDMADLICPFSDMFIESILFSEFAHWSTRPNSVQVAGTVYKVPSSTLTPVLVTACVGRRGCQINMGALFLQYQLNQVYNLDTFYLSVNYTCGRPASCYLYDTFCPPALGPGPDTSTSGFLKWDDQWRTTDVTYPGSSAPGFVLANGIYITDAYALEFTACDSVANNSFCAEDLNKFALLFSYTVNCSNAVDLWVYLDGVFIGVIPSSHAPMYANEDSLRRSEIALPVGHVVYGGQHNISIRVSKNATGTCGTGTCVFVRDVTVLTSNPSDVCGTTCPFRSHSHSQVPPITFSHPPPPLLGGPPDTTSKSHHPHTHHSQSHHSQSKSHHSDSKSHKSHSHSASHKSRSHSKSHRSHSHSKSHHSDSHSKSHRSHSHSKSHHSDSHSKSHRSHSHSKSHHSDSHSKSHRSRSHSKSHNSDSHSKSHHSESHSKSHNSDSHSKSHHSESHSKSHNSDSHSVSHHSDSHSKSHNSESHSLSHHSESHSKSHQSDSNSASHQSDSNSASHQSTSNSVSHQSDSNSMSHQSVSNTISHQSGSNSASHQSDSNSISHQSASNSASHYSDSNSASHQSDSNSVSHQSSSNSASHQSDSNSASHQSDSNSVSHQSDSNSASHYSDSNSASHQSASNSISHQSSSNSASHQSDSNSESHQSSSNSVSHQSDSNSASHYSDSNSPSHQSASNSLSHQSDSNSASHYSDSSSASHASQSFSSVLFNFSQSESISMSPPPHCVPGNLPINITAFYRGSNLTSLITSTSCGIDYALAPHPLGVFQPYVGISFPMRVFGPFPLGVYIQSVSFYLVVFGAYNFNPLSSVQFSYTSSCGIFDLIGYMQINTPVANYASNCPGLFAEIPPGGVSDELQITYILNPHQVPADATSFDLIFTNVPPNVGFLLGKVTFSTSTDARFVVDDRPCSLPVFPVIPCDCKACCLLTP